ncbi:angiotensin-converting enzyme-like [Leguminivora glycinivorella]|uniref:angiotensin-converting enzyme-like n=1 Tax=Leguminivora glycinivorella TaxID=1035111 RepID=UPI00200D75F2|nr:angiotensin-converting enzyme-like [Leguminivora glycinivorella]
MKLLNLLIFLATVIGACTGSPHGPYIRHLNDVTIKFNAAAAEIAWESSVDPGNPELPLRSANYQRQRIAWEERSCARLASLERSQLLNGTERRMAYLFCRGPRFTLDEAMKISKLYERLQSIYSDAKVCIPFDKTKPPTDLSGMESAILDYIATVKRVLNVKSEGVSRVAKLAVNEKSETSLCLYGDTDFDKMMRFSRNEEVLRWLWISWREKVGPPMKKPYRELVDVENRAAKRNGYTDIGATWRDESEVTDLRLICRRLYNRVKPLYSLLHGVARYYLRKKYGDIVPEKGAIPAHLLGNLWAQNWESIADLILPQIIDLDKSIKNTNWTTVDMVKHAEDFYQSLGLPAMTDTFWRQSVFERRSATTRCHGTAADLFQGGDFRLLYCSGSTAEDLYVIHHELGHIQYYMAYENQPGIFRQANSALHETIGDTIMYGVLTPQHLYRLGLINDSMLFINPKLDTKLSSQESLPKEQLHSIDSTNEDPQRDNIDEEILKSKEIHENSNAEWKDLTTDDILLLKQALNKIPQIPFALVIDEYRWRYFEGDLKEEALNEEFWDLMMELQGVAPPERRSEEGFDAGAKYHVPDNTPFIRYFLSSFLQHQLFESLCKAAVFGRVGAKEHIPKTIPMNRCDIYGSKAAGKLLKELMSKGHSHNYQELLQVTIGIDGISSSALERYYRPLHSLLVKHVRALRIPIGW